MGWIADVPLQHAADAGTDVRMAVPALVENGDPERGHRYPLGARQPRIRCKLKDN
jgi:hypothetical protein